MAKYNNFDEDTVEKIYSSITNKNIIIKKSAGSEYTCLRKISNLNHQYTSDGPFADTDTLGAEKYGIFNSHLLFDPYCRGDNGNASILSTKYFAANILNYAKSQKNNKREFNSLLKIFDDGIFFSGKIYGYIAKKFENENMYDISQLLNDNNDNLKKYISNMREKILHILNGVRDQIENLLKRYQEVYLPWGINSHAIGIYFKKISNDEYYFVISNSGQGIHYHNFPKIRPNVIGGSADDNADDNADNEKELIIEKKISYKKLVLLLSFHALLYSGNHGTILQRWKDYLDLKKKLSEDTDDEYYNTDDEYYNTDDEYSEADDEYFEADDDAKDFSDYIKILHLSESREDDINKFYKITKDILESEITSDVYNVLYFHEPQLSGSCSFYSIYHFVRYFFIKNIRLDDFNRMMNKIKEYNIRKIFDAYSKYSCLTNYDYNAIELLNFIGYSNESLVEKFTYNIRNATFIPDKNKIGSIDTLFNFNNINNVHVLTDMHKYEINYQMLDFNIIGDDIITRINSIIKYVESCQKILIDYKTHLDKIPNTTNERYFVCYYVLPGYFIQNITNKILELLHNNDIYTSKYQYNNFDDYIVELIDLLIDLVFKIEIISTAQLKKNNNIFMNDTSLAKLLILSIIHKLDINSEHKIFIDDSGEITSAERTHIFYTTRDQIVDHLSINNNNYSVIYERYQGLLEHVIDIATVYLIKYNIYQINYDYIVGASYSFEYEQKFAITVNVARSWENFSYGTINIASLSEHMKNVYYNADDKFKKVVAIMNHPFFSKYLYLQMCAFTNLLLVNKDTNDNVIFVPKLSLSLDVTDSGNTVFVQIQGSKYLNIFQNIRSINKDHYRKTNNKYTVETIEMLDMTKTNKRLVLITELINNGNIKELNEAYYFINPFTLSMYWLPFELFQNRFVSSGGMIFTNDRNITSKIDAHYRVGSNFRMDMKFIEVNNSPYDYYLRMKLMFNLNLSSFITYLDEIRPQIVICLLLNMHFFNRINEITKNYNDKIKSYITNFIDNIDNEIDKYQISYEEGNLLEYFYCLIYTLIWQDIIYLPKISKYVYAYINDKENKSNIIGLNLLFNELNRNNNPIFFSDLINAYVNIINYNNIDDPDNGKIKDQIIKTKKILENNKIKYQSITKNKKIYDNVMITDLEIKISPNEYYDVLRIFDMGNELQYFMDEYIFYYHEKIIYGLSNEYRKILLVVTEDKFRIETIINGNDYELLNINNSDLLDTKLFLFLTKITNFSDNITKNKCHFIVWVNKQKSDQYVIDFPNIKKDLENNILNKNYVSLTYDNKTQKIFMNDFELVTSPQHQIINKWIYELDNCILLKKGTIYKIIMLHDYDFFSQNSYYRLFDDSIWFHYDYREKNMNIKTLFEFPIHKSSEQDNNNVYYYEINVSYCCQFLHFSDAQTIRLYMCYCIVKGKNSCINNIVYQYKNYILENTYENQLLMFNVPYTTYYVCLTLDNIQLFVPKDIIIIENYEADHEKRIKYYYPKYRRYSDNHKHIFSKYNGQEYRLKYDNEHTAIKTLLSNHKKINHQNPKDFSFLTNDDLHNLETFIKSYRSCDFNNFNIMTIKNSLKNFKNDYENTIEKIYDVIYQQMEFGYNYSSLEIILINHDKYYNLIEIIKLHGIMENIEKLCSDNSCNCNEIKKLYSMIDNNEIYTGTRNCEVILFEIVFGNFVKKQQMQIYKNIVNETKEKRTYSIYQLLMGQGKTSVITPLIALNAIYSDTIASNNVVIILPSHLIDQTYHDLFLRDYSPILSDYNIHRIAVNRNDDNSKYYKYFDSNENYKNLIITDDTSLKTLLLNQISNKIFHLTNDNVDIVEITRKNSYIVFDEFDKLYDPHSSNLNFPINDRLIENKNMIFSFCLDVSELIFGFNAKMETDKKIDAMNIVDQCYLLLSKKNKYDSLDIFLNYIIKDNKSFDINLTSEKIPLFKIYYKIYHTLIDCMMLIYNLNYGFGDLYYNNQYHESNYYLAIPYSAVSSPINGSRFTDIFITIILTVFSYIRKGLRHQDIIVITDAIKEYNNISLDLFKMVNAQYIKIFKQYNFDIVDYVTNNKKITKMSYNSDMVFNILLQNKYLLDLVLPKFISETDVQLNATFLDVMKKNFVELKTAFSGTVNLDLLNTKNDINEFTQIKESTINNGEIISAFLGVAYKKPHVYNYDINNSQILDTIMNKVIHDEYNCLIDLGAFLINYSVYDVVKEILKRDQNKICIFIDEHDNKKMAKKIDNDIIIEKMTLNFVSGENLFIYYDNKHVVGTDIRQPYFMKGLCTIGKNNKYSDTSQAIYRMRNLNYGHSISFALNQIIKYNGKSIDNAEQLYLYLKNCEDEYKKSSYHALLLQNIKYYRKIIDINNFKEKVFNEFEYQDFVDYVKKNFCDGYYNQSEIIDSCQQIVNFYSLNDHELHNDKNMVNEQEQSKEQQENKEVQYQINTAYSFDEKLYRQINVNISDTIFFRTDDYFQIINVYEFYENSNVFNFLNMNNIYLSPIMMRLYLVNFKTSFPTFSYFSFAQMRKLVPNFTSESGKLAIDSNISKVFNYYYIHKNRKYSVITFEEYQYLNHLKFVRPNIFLKNVNEYINEHNIYNIIIKLSVLHSLSIKELMLLIKHVIKNNQIDEFILYINQLSKINTAMRTIIIDILSYNILDIIKKYRNETFDYLQKMYNTSDYKSLLGYVNLQNTPDKYKKSVVQMVYGDIIIVN